MENKIVLRENKKILSVFRIAIIFLILFTIYLLLPELKQKDNLVLVWGIVALAVIFLMWIALEFYFHISYLELGMYECCYRNMFGRKRKFLLSDISEVQFETSQNEPKGYWSLCNDRGEQLSRISISMINADQVIPFFEYCRNAGLWNGLICDEYDKVKVIKVGGDFQEFSSGIKENPYLDMEVQNVIQNDEKKEKNIGKDLLNIENSSDMPDTIAVYPNKNVYGKIIPFILIDILLICLIVYGSIRLANGYITNEKIAYMLFCVMLFSLFMVFTYKKQKRVNAIHKNMCLILTTKICQFTDSKGVKCEFDFQDIESVEKVYEEVANRRHKNVYLKILLKSGISLERIPYNDTMENIKVVQAFVVYHKNKVKM